MAKQRYVVRLDENGKAKVVPFSGRVVLSKHADVELPFEKQMLKSYYDLECKQGSRFRPNYGEHSARTIKEAWSREDKPNG